MRVYSTIPIEVTRIGEHLNTISTTVARNPKIEEVTGHDFIVYLTYSYDEKDRLGWILSSQYGVYQGTQKDCDNEWSPYDYALSGQMHLKPFGFRGAMFFDTEKEALEAQEKWEAEITTPALEVAENGSERIYMTEGDYIASGDYKEPVTPAQPKSKPALWERFIDWLFIG